MLDFLRTITPPFLLSLYHFFWALGGVLRFGFPSRGMIVIGVTGTNGKSTTVDMIARIFREAGLKVASLSSIRFQILEKEWQNRRKMTMPGRFAIQKFLRDAKNAGCTHVVLEVTSEGILQHRHRFINFHTAVFTNLSPEHIERHGSFEKYREAKGKLFEVAKHIHVINRDDENAGYFLKFPAKETLQYSMVDARDITLKLLGEFNYANAAAAVATTKAHGIPFEVSKRALEKMEGVPGRMELVIREPFKVVVDYAFTPAALEKVYKTFRENPKSEIRNPKLICVLGAAGGGRDKWKRPILGKLAATYCGQVIVTNEDPYNEDPSQILSQIKSGITNSQFPMTNFYETLDRREAIRRALSLAQPGDTVVVTGKGSEDSIAQAGKKIPWDDRQVVREEFSRLVDKNKNKW